jgi:hypothetical protein
MIARVATFDPLRNDLDDDAVELLRKTVRETPGYVAGFHMLDPKSRKALSVAVFEDREALARVDKALGARPGGREVGIQPDRVEHYETFGF